MEIKATLSKPYSEKEKMDFIVKNNHNLGFKIIETEKSLEAWGYTQDEELASEQELIKNSYLTRADVERGIYQAKGMDFDDVLELVKELNPEKIDLKALKIELKANNFYRKNPYVETIGQLLGFSSLQLDNFFKTNDYKALTTN